MVHALGQQFTNKGAAILKARYATFLLVSAVYSIGRKSGAINYVQ